MSYRWHKTEPLKIFVGYDRKEPLAFRVLAHSIWSRATAPVTITPLVRSQLHMIHTRERGPTESTEFAFTRFLVPYLCGYEGHAVFMDCDFLCQTDVADLWDYITTGQSAAVTVCKHDYVPKTQTKFLEQQQTVYPRKNWSSLMIFDNTRCKKLSPLYVDTATGLELHRFQWLLDSEIAALPLEWNWLAAEYNDNPAAKMIHYTLGGPWFSGYEHAPMAEVWWEEYANFLAASDLSTIRKDEPAAHLAENTQRMSLK